MTETEYTKAASKSLYWDCVMKLLGRKTPTVEELPKGKYIEMENVKND